MRMNANEFEEVGDMVEVSIHVLGVRIESVVCRRTE